MTPLDRDSPPLIMGIDGGGSTTRCWLAAVCASNSPQLLSQKVAGPSNPLSVGTGQAARTIRDLVSTVLAEHGVSSVSATCICLAGSGNEAEQSAVLAQLDHSLWTHRIQLTDDASAVVRAVAPTGAGLGVISGTGSLCVGFDSFGRQLRSGGAGPLIGDEGSGYWLAREGLRRAIWSLDGRAEKTLLVERFADRIGVCDRAALVAAVYRDWQQRDRLASLADCVLAAARDGDLTATQLIHAAAEELVRIIGGVLDQFGQLNTRIPCGFAGGLLVHASELRNELVTRMKQMGWPVQPPIVVESPAAGAVNLAALMLADSSG